MSSSDTSTDDYNNRNKNIRDKGTWGMPVKDVQREILDQDRSPDTTRGSSGQGTATGDQGGPAGKPVEGGTVGEIPPA